MKNVVNVSGVIAFNENDEVLLLNHTKKREGGQYGFPGGKMESNENSLQCAIREFKEETGLTAFENEMFELPTSYRKKSIKKGTEVNYNMTMYYCNKWTGYTRKSKEGTPEWFTVSDVSKLPGNVCKSHLKEMLKECSAYRREITSVV